MGIEGYPPFAFDTRLWKWVDRDISHLWKRYKVVVVISRRSGYNRMPA
jgi:hypothetical protein